MLNTWIALPTLYKLWKLTSAISTELFADCFNESGMLPSYCSGDDADYIFGSLGCWEENEEWVEGGERIHLLRMVPYER